MDISYITKGVYSGVTSSGLADVILPLTLTKFHTALAFVVCHDTGLTPVVNDWVKISEVNGVSGCTFLYIFQPTGITVNPHYSISGLSNKLNTVTVMLFSGCTYHSSRVVNNIISEDNLNGTGVVGFDTTVDKTMIIQFIGLFSSFGVSGYSSIPSLIWEEKLDTEFTHLTFTVHISVAISPLSPKDKYINFDYSFFGSTTNESIVTVVSLTPRLGNVSMTMNTL